MGICLWTRYVCVWLPVDVLKEPYIVQKRDLDAANSAPCSAERVLYSIPEKCYILPKELRIPYPENPIFWYKSPISQGVCLLRGVCVHVRVHVRVCVRYVYACMCVCECA